MASTETLRGRAALITGGSRGIGLAIAQALVKEGCSVALAGRDQKALSAAERTLTEGHAGGGARATSA